VRVVAAGLAVAVRVTCLAVLTVRVAEVLAAAPVSEGKGADSVVVGAGAVVSVGAGVDVVAGDVVDAAGGGLSDETGWAC
jgi:hypothetical protein